jgi:predicted nucleic-acid-binding protein
LIRNAITFYLNGLDFADALHMGLSQKDEVLLTFKKTFVKQAAKHSQSTPVQKFKK